MLLSPRKNGRTSIFKEVRVFKVLAHGKKERSEEEGDSKEVFGNSYLGPLESFSKKSQERSEQALRTLS